MALSTCAPRRSTPVRAKKMFGRTYAAFLRCSAALLLAGVIGPAQSPPQPAPPEQPLVRLNVDLVQVDAVVTDAKGNHVTDLKPEEFKIFEDGKAQRITNFSFIQDGTRAVTTLALAVDGQRMPPPPVAPARILPGHANRTIAVVVDDLGLSEQSFSAIHQALERFIDQQVQPGDLVAIIRTSGRHGELQRLTADKRLLIAAVNSFRSLPNHRP